MECHDECFIHAGIARDRRSREKHVKVTGGKITQSPKTCASPNVTSLTLLDFAFQSRRIMAVAFLHSGGKRKARNRSGRFLAPSFYPTKVPGSGIESNLVERLADRWRGIGVAGAGRRRGGCGERGFKRGPGSSQIDAALDLERGTFDARPCDQARTVTGGSETRAATGRIQS